jgi:amidohydrolase
MAAADEFRIEVIGAGGHAARPHLAVDPVVIASHIVVALQTLVSRELNPFESAVLTVGKLAAGTTFNVIPESATIEGTVRTYSVQIQDLLERRITEMATLVGEAMRASVTVDYERGYPPLINHPGGAGLVQNVVEEMLGGASWIEKEPVMGAEDFAYILENVPDGAMFWLGVRDPAWPQPRPVHSPIFDLDERALPIGAAVMAETALRFLNQSPAHAPA